MQTDSAEGGPLRDPASVLLPGMHLLAQLTSAEPGLALSLVQMQVPSGAEGDADLLTLAAGCLSLQRAAARLSDAEALQPYGELLPYRLQATHGVGSSLLQIGSTLRLPSRAT